MCLTTCVPREDWVKPKMFQSDHWFVWEIAHVYFWYYYPQLLKYVLIHVYPAKAKISLRCFNLIIDSCEKLHMSVYCIITRNC